LCDETFATARQPSSWCEPYRTQQPGGAKSALSRYPHSMSAEMPERIARSTARIVIERLGSVRHEKDLPPRGAAPLSQAIRRARSKKSQGWLSSWPDLSENLLFRQATRGLRVLSDSSGLVLAVFTRQPWHSRDVPLYTRAHCRVELVEPDELVCRSQN